MRAAGAGGSSSTMVSRLRGVHVDARGQARLTTARDRR